jgi:hypothetical protein
MERKLRELATRMEEHELDVWATCVEAVSELPGNPLHAAIDRSGPVPLMALGAVDRGDINKVLALGVRAPARSEDLDAVCSFYESQGQLNYRVELTPLARPSYISEWIAARGLACDNLGTFKMWRGAERPPVADPAIEVRRLGRDDADALMAINVAAWGAWSMPVSLSEWFGASLGQDGVQNYGVFDGDRLVATGALFIGDGLGWFGFDATHPRYQGRKLRQAISSVRIVDAAAHGCTMIHAESTMPPSARALRDGWQLLYEKQNYSSVRVEASVTAAGSARPDPQRVLDALGDLS